MAAEWRSARPCPLCSGQGAALAFPYRTIFHGQCFDYVRCADCGTVYVAPLPDAQTFARMYAKSEYHDHFYEHAAADKYVAAARLLKRVAPGTLDVLDYGCGLGDFLLAAKAEGLAPHGVEFDAAAAREAAHRADCEVSTVDDFLRNLPQGRFDAVHLCDVLAHLPDPAGTLRALLRTLRPGGCLFVEGPLQNNASPVYWVARAVGWVKRLLRRPAGHHAPTHLFLPDARQQREFFSRVDPHLACRHWDVHETGWPYTDGSRLKRAIAAVAMRVGGKHVMGMQFGNRYRAVFKARAVDEEKP